MVNGEDPEVAVLETAKKSVADSAQIMAEVYEAEHGVPINLHNPNVTKWTERGEGADDITGQHLRTGTAVADDVGPEIRVEGPSNACPELGGGVQSDLDNFNMLDGSLSNFSGDVDIDFNSYLGGTTMGMNNNPSHFGRSPEWFYDLNGWANVSNATLSTDFNVDYERVLGTEMF